MQTLPSLRFGRARDVDRCETNLKLCTESRLETRECMTQLHFHELTGKFSDTSTAERERDQVESAMKLKHGNEIRHSECGRQETEQPRGCAFELSEEEALGPDSGAKICSFESSFESSSDQNSRNLLPKFRYTDTCQRSIQRSAFLHPNHAPVLLGVRVVDLTKRVRRKERDSLRGKKTSRSVSFAN